MRETEARSELTVGLDALGTEDLLRRLLIAHADVPEVVAQAAPATARAVDGAVERLAAGGRLVYAGSGTPGWLVEGDAAELSPTFGFPRERLVVVRARPALGPEAGEEDSAERGAGAMAEHRITQGDVVVAVASSGSTPFTLGAARRAAEAGAMTVGVANVPDSPLARVCSVAILLRTGAEPIMGSTRMRAGLAQRLWLTVFSTATMTRLGLTHDNLMVNVAPALEKLRERRLAILSELTGAPREPAIELLDRAGDDLRVAIVMTEAGVDRTTADEALSATGGRTRAAIERLGGR